MLVAGELADRFARLRTLAVQGRPGRVAVLGRRGAGKSSLINAVMDREAAAVGHVEDTTRETQHFAQPGSTHPTLWWDTPGLRAGGHGSRRTEAVARALARVQPDVALLVCQASEVDAGIDDDLDDVAAVLTALERCGGTRPSLVGVVSKLDELAPADDAEPPFAHPDKRRAIRHATSVLGAHLRRHGLAPAFVMPVNTYAVYAPDGVDLRWNVAQLRARVGGLLPTASALQGVLYGRELRRAILETMDGVTAVVAEIAAARARRGEPSEPALHEVLARVLRALAPSPPSARAGPVDLSEITAQSLGWLRSSAARLGAHRASAALTASELRATGSAVARRQLAQFDDAQLAAHFNGPRPR